MLKLIDCLVLISNNYQEMLQNNHLEIINSVKNLYHSHKYIHMIKAILIILIDKYLFNCRRKLKPWATLHLKAND